MASRTWPPGWRLGGGQHRGSANPTLLSRYNTTGWSYAVQVVGRLAYVADEVGGLQVIDVGDAGRPQWFVRTNWIGAALGLHVVGNLAYVAAGLSGLQIIDVSDPARLSRLGGISIRGSAFNLQVVENRAYVAGEATGLHIIDVTDPRNPGIRDFPYGRERVSRASGRWSGVRSGRTAWTRDHRNPASDGLAPFGSVRDGGVAIEVQVIGKLSTSPAAAQVSRSSTSAGREVLCS